MAVAPMGAVLRQFSRLFAGGNVSGLSEAQLLDRFVKSRDEAAFAALVERFGPMVLGVCRKQIGDPHAAEDAFQATFLVLVRRAGSIRDGDLLGNWLYGVALKVARRARADLSRKQRREKGGEDVDSRPDRDPATSAAFDVGPLLHEELARLPDTYRKPLVLCFLDGRTHEEAARLLRWPVGTVKGRIARGKDLLRERLGRKGVTVTSAAIAATLAETASATVPPILLEATVKAAMGIAAGGAIAAGACSATAVAWSERVVAAMTMTKFKLAAAALVALGTVATGAGVMARQQEAKAAAEKIQDNPTEAQRQPAALEKVDATGKVPPRTGLLHSKTNQGTTTYATTYDTANGPGVAEDLLRDEPAVGALPSPQELAAKRVKAAEDLLNSQWVDYVRATGTSAPVLAAAQRLAEARIAADETRRVQALEYHVRFLRSLSKREQGRFDSGTSTFGSWKRVEADLAEAEILLSKARSGEAVAAKTQPGEGPDDEDSPERNRAIREFLAKPLEMPFATETPLDEVLKYVTQAATPDPKGKPLFSIYVDPVGLSQAEKTMASPVTINLDNVPLRTSLRLLLHQLDLSYYIKDGLLIISSPASDTFPESAMTSLEKSRRAEEKEEMKRARATGGGGGGFR